MGENNQNSEGSIWFWRIFGGAIIGMITLLAVTLLNVINNSNQQSKSDMLASIQEIRSDIKILNNDFNLQKEKLSAIESAKFGDEIKTIKEKLDQVTTIVNNRNEKIAAIESSLAALKDKVVSTEDKAMLERIVVLENELKNLKLQSNNIVQDVETKKTMLIEH